MKRKNPTPLPKAVLYFRSIGLGAISLAGAAFLAPFPGRFVVMCVFMYIAILTLGIDFWIERRTYALLAVILAIGFTRYFVWIDRSLVIGAIDDDMQQAPGHPRIGNLPWLPEYSELHVFLNNNTDNDYTDLDLIVRPDEPIVAIQTSFPNVTFSESSEASARLQLLSAKIEQSLDVLAADTGYRVRFDRLPHKTRIDLEMAVASPASGNAETNDVGYWIRIGTDTPHSKGTGVWFKRAQDDMTEGYWQPRKPANVVVVDGEYTALLRRQYISHQSVTVSDPLKCCLDKIPKQ